MTYKSRKTASQQLTGLGFVVGLHLVGIYMVATGLAHQAVQNVMAPIETKVIEEAKPKAEELPPPPPKLQTPPPYVPPPDLDVAIDAPPPTTQTNAIAVVSNKPVPVAPVAPPTPDVEAKFDPRGRYNAFPDTEYPSQSRRLNEEGKVKIAILVQADNTVGEVKVVESSGFERLDNAAVEWYRKRGRFLAAVKDGQPIASWKTITVNFQLKK
jgi:periplasmic protein TonB